MEQMSEEAQIKEYRRNCNAKDVTEIHTLKPGEAALVLFISREFSGSDSSLTLVLTINIHQRLPLEVLDKMRFAPIRMKIVSNNAKDVEKKIKEGFEKSQHHDLIKILSFFNHRKRDNFNKIKVLELEQFVIDAEGKPKIPPNDKDSCLYSNTNSI